MFLKMFHCFLDHNIGIMYVDLNAILTLSKARQPRVELQTFIACIGSSWRPFLEVQLEKHRKEFEPSKNFYFLHWNERNDTYIDNIARVNFTLLVSICYTWHRKLTMYVELCLSKQCYPNTIRSQRVLINRVLPYEHFDVDAESDR